GASQTDMFITGGSGDADLYLYQWVGSWKQICRPYLSGNEENCSAEMPDGAGTYQACLDGYTSYSNVRMHAGYVAANHAAYASAADVAPYYVDYWKDNLFLGIAYHRIACFSSDGIIVSDQDYDGFSNGDYCRKGKAWDSPKSYGAKDYIRSNSLGTSFTAARDKLNSCGSQANTAYGTPGYARRSDGSGRCKGSKYHLLNDCNSDCWIREFSSCVTPGNPIAIKSPCW
ncbi:MAG TPA: hypothetical protein VML75_07880, partial [Kofleriaceae bacterium]|nr:hypothetical protein [Kofleriaceae bacterium]